MNKTFVSIPIVDDDGNMAALKIWQNENGENFNDFLQNLKDTHITDPIHESAPGMVKSQVNSWKNALKRTLLQDAHQSGRRCRVQHSSACRHHVRC